jgi:hypothetical protein
MTLEKIALTGDGTPRIVRVGARRTYRLTRLFLRCRAVRQLNPGRPLDGVVIAGGADYRRTTRLGEAVTGTLGPPWP